MVSEPFPFFEAFWSVAQEVLHFSTSKKRLVDLTTGLNDWLKDLMSKYLSNTCSFSPEVLRYLLIKSFTNKKSSKFNHSFLSVCWWQILSGDQDKSFIQKLLQIFTVNLWNRTNSNPNPQPLPWPNSESRRIGKRVRGVSCYETFVSDSNNQGVR